MAITSFMRSSNSSRVSTFLLHTSLFIQPRKQKSNGVGSGDLRGQFIVLPWPIPRLGKDHLDFYVWVSVHHKSISYKETTRCNFGSIVY
jgi:hypothetical protein